MKDESISSALNEKILERSDRNGVLWVKNKEERIDYSKCPDRSSIKSNGTERRNGQDKEEQILSEENISITREIEYRKNLEDKNAEENSDKFDKFPNCKEEMGRELRENNDKICEYICNLKNQREELIYIIEKQYEERKKLETEMERITYKLCLINKSMAQRIKTKNLYDQTIQEIETNYSKLVQDSEAILALIKSQYDNLDGMINKKTSTDETFLTSPDEQASGEHPQQNKVCNCHIKIKENKERSHRSSRSKTGRVCKCINKFAKPGDDTD